MKIHHLLLFVSVENAIHGRSSRGSAVEEEEETQVACLSLIQGRMEEQQQQQQQQSKRAPVEAASQTRVRSVLSRSPSSDWLCCTDKT
jgi:hypothetical protein